MLLDPQAASVCCDQRPQHNKHTLVSDIASRRHKRSFHCAAARQLDYDHKTRQFMRYYISLKHYISGCVYKCILMCIMYMPRQLGQYSTLLPHCNLSNVVAFYPNKLLQANKLWPFGHPWIYLLINKKCNINVTLFWQ